MSFTFCVERTVNGRPRTVRFHDVPEDQRASQDRLIEDFNRGLMSMEGIYTVNHIYRGVPTWTRSWRWADVKRLWIEES